MKKKSVCIYIKRWENNLFWFASISEKNLKNQGSSKMKIKKIIESESQQKIHFWWRKYFVWPGLDSQNSKRRKWWWWYHLPYNVQQCTAQCLGHPPGCGRYHINSPLLPDVDKGSEVGSPTSQESKFKSQKKYVLAIKFMNSFGLT